MDNSSVPNLKSDLRRQIRDARFARFNQQPMPGVQTTEELSNQIDLRLRELCSQLAVNKVAAYLSYGTEPETRPFLNWAQSNDIQVLLPNSLADGQLQWVVFDGETTEDGIHGFAEAVGEKQHLDSVDLVILPALAVDKKGTRLGQGKGYYDRALAQLDGSKPTVAVIFDTEILHELPSEPHDKPVWAAVAPNQTIIF
jgi:5-formyltetrahydrofolate cyclo-ligase